MKAKYPGTCTATGQHYPAGAEIEKGPHGWQLAGAKPQDRTLQPGELRVARGEGYGYGPYRAGEVFNDPRHGYLVVRVAWSEYYREDGLSFGVGDDRGYIYLAHCRQATPAEYMPLWEAEQADQRYHAQRAAIKAQFERLFAFEDGEYVASDSQLVLDGERIKIGQGFTIYGTGEEMVIDADGQHIWRVRNNGMDGDDWSRNNVRTGGAGAIGYRFAATPERLACLAALQSPTAPDQPQPISTADPLAFMDLADGECFICDYDRNPGIVYLKMPAGANPDWPLANAINQSTRLWSSFGPLAPVRRV